jgi:5-methylcytosine-specific restriction endonuclease McrA
MMDETATPKQGRLRTLQTKLADQHRAVIAENGVLLEELVTLIHDLDPIRRQMMWPAELIEYLAQRQGWKCPACGDEIPSLNERAHHVDHIVPWSLGGGNEISNIQVLHVTCNLSKGRRCDLDNLIRYLQGRLFNIG